MWQNIYKGPKEQGVGILNSFLNSQADVSVLQLFFFFFLICQTTSIWDYRNVLIILIPRSVSFNQSIYQSINQSLFVLTFLHSRIHCILLTFILSLEIYKKLAGFWLREIPYLLLEFLLDPGLKLTAIEQPSPEGFSSLLIMFSKYRSANRSKTYLFWNLRHM